jgi:FkbM family methyltransferase
MINYLLSKIRARRTRKQFKEFGFKIVDFHLSNEGKIHYAQWLHPAEFSNHPGNAGNVVTQESVDFYRHLVQDGDMVIDVGAHEGDTIVPMALAVGKAGVALALEPNPHSFKVLEANARLNPEKTRIIPVNFAATSTDGEFTFGSSDPSFGNGGIVGFTHNANRNIRYTFNVPGKNLEQYVDKNHSGHRHKIALIKIDAEGYDKEIIKTLPKIIRENRPYLITECFGPSTGQEKLELFHILSQLEYELYRLSGFTFKNLTKISQGEMTGKKTFDILAVPFEKIKDLQNGENYDGSSSRSS